MKQYIEELEHAQSGTAVNFIMFDMLKREGLVLSEVVPVFAYLFSRYDLIALLDTSTFALYANEYKRLAEMQRTQDELQMIESQFQAD